MKSFLHRLPVRRRLLLSAAVVISLTAAVLAGRPWIARQVEAGIRARLQESGLAATWESSSWDPLRGQHFSGLRLSQSQGSGGPIAEFGQLNFKLPFRQYFGGSEGTTSWDMDSSPLVLHDEAGSVRLDQASLKIISRDGKFDVSSLTARQGGLRVDLTGTLRTASSARESDFSIDLKVLRATLSTLDIAPDTGPFRVTGSFTIDSTRPDLIWSVRVKGEGRDLRWNGIDCTHATANGDLTSSGTRIHYQLLSNHGATHGEVTRAGREEAPFVFAGSLQDAAGHEDIYHGRYHERVLTLESLKGAADLWELSKDVPALTQRRPDAIRFKTFPALEIVNLRRRTGSGEPVITVESLKVTSEDPVGFTIDGRLVEVREFSVKGAYEEREWTISGSHASLLGGTASLTGRYRENVLRRAKISVEDFRVSDLQRLSGQKAGKSSGRITAGFQGSIDFSKQDCEGSGSLRMTDAPVVQVPLLDQVYELFAGLIPGVKPAGGKGEFNAEFAAHPDVIDVTCFEARGGSSISVSAVGKIDLRKRRVHGQARGKLNGLPGLVTSPLSRLLEMEVVGPYDDIRVKPLGPAKLVSNTVNATVGAPIDTLQETGKITGTVLKEGIKLPFKWMEKEQKPE